MTISSTEHSAVTATPSAVSSSATRVRLGAHVSGGGLKGIPGKAVEIGCEGVQIFASSPQMWRPPSIKPADDKVWTSRVPDRRCTPPHCVAEIRGLARLLVVSAFVTTDVDVAADILAAVLCAAVTATCSFSSSP